MEGAEKQAITGILCKMIESQTADMVFGAHSTANQNRRCQWKWNKSILTEVDFLFKGKDNNARIILIIDVPALAILQNRKESKYFITDNKHIEQELVR